MLVSTPSDYAYLEDLIVGNPDLEYLESLLEQFNIFEALGTVRIELRHSDFLAFLLNPNQNHGLEDLFVRRLLQKAVASTQVETPITPIGLDVLDLDDLVVLREWQNLDILILDEKNRLAVLIENKISSSEHSDQLRRYRARVKEHYPGFRQLCLFLTPDGEKPSDDEYIPIDYGMIAVLVDALSESRASVLGPDVRTLMSHYSQMLRRHIVSDSKIAELCRKIYRKHQRALDLIYEYRPDKQAELQTILENLISSEPALGLEHSSKSYIEFVPKSWDIPLLLQGQGWTRSGHILLFEFGNFSNRLKLSLIIGPGPTETRQRLLTMAQNHHPLRPAFKALGKSFNTIYVRDWLKAKDYEESGTDELESKIKELWVQFLAHDFLTVLQIIEDQDWIKADDLPINIGE